MDIVERLRNSCRGGDGCACTLNDAANEIERLRAVESMRDQELACVREKAGLAAIEADRFRDELVRVRGKLFIAEKDAVRYRWMRNERGSWPGIVAGEELDNMVDVGLSRHA